MDHAIQEVLRQQHIETPSWGYGNAGTRFKTFATPGAARNVWEKIEDAALIYKLSGIAPSVALHIPWDKTEDWHKLKAFAKEQGIQIGAINPNVFQDDAYKLGSIAHPDKQVREKAVRHILECVQVMQIAGSRDLSLWFADGTNYAEQDDLRSRKALTREALPEGKQLRLTYKFFEPACYFADLFGWGAALLVDRAALTEAQQAGGMLEAHCTLLDAYKIDARPMLTEVREDMGVPDNPIKALREGQYLSQRIKQRGTIEASGGYQA